MEGLSGPEFVRFARNLPYYAGAVQAKMKADYYEAHENGELDENTQPSTPQKSTPSVKLKMTEAMQRYGDDLDGLNYESESAMGGTLFERVSVPGN